MMLGIGCKLPFRQLQDRVPIILETKGGPYFFEDAYAIVMNDQCHETGRSFDRDSSVFPSECSIALLNISVKL